VAVIFTAADSRLSVLHASIQKTEAALENKESSYRTTKSKDLLFKNICSATRQTRKEKMLQRGSLYKQALLYFSIVNDSTYWIVANFKETQIKKFHPGMPVEIALDAYPDMKLNGTIESLSDATGAKFSLLPPDNASGNFVKVTQRIPVKIAINGHR
jgi:membrane fusion protein (multidrug efflux system)